VITRECAALASWYGSRPEIRRLLAMKDALGLRVLVDLEPTNDGNETDVAWLANHHAWIDELQLRIGSAVRLEHVDESFADDVETGARGVIVAALSWRDPSVI
jgi:hypothetical protein